MTLTNIQVAGWNVLGGVAQRMNTGNTFFVYSGKGSDSADGSKETPFATLDKALSACTDSNDDRIYLMAGHAETITGAGGITIDKAGVSIIGLGRYDARPAFLMDGATTVTCLVTSANCSFENVVFRAGHANIVVWGTITAKGFGLYNCAFEENTGSENWLIGPSVGANDNDADGFEMIGCTWKGETAGSNVVVINTNQKDIRIVGNTITGDFSASTYAPIYSPDTEVQLNIRVSDNIIHNLHDANAAVGISIANTASTGFIVRNLIGHQDSAAETPILAGAAGLFVAENYCSGVLGTASCYLYPAVDT